MKFDKTKQRIALNGEWAFTYTPGRDFASRGINIMTGVVPIPGVMPVAEEFDCVMPVPGYWDDHLDSLRPRDWWAGAKFNPDYRPIEFPMGLDSPDASLSYLVGTGWYRREFFIPQQWRGGLIGLYIGGVVMDACVWINGKKAGCVPWHSTPYEIRIDGHLNYGGTNEVVIAVDNTRRDRIGLNIRGYPGRSGGIFRDVWIGASGSGRIEDFHVYRRGDALVWKAELAGPVPPGAALRWSVCDGRTGEAKGCGEQEARGETVAWETGLLGMTPWSDRDPALHTVTLELYQGETLADAAERPFGMRELTARGMSLFLNGRPILLRGATEHFYYPLTCTAPRDVNAYIRNLRKLREMGFNWMRFHTWVPSEEYMEAADRVGVMIQVEPAYGFTAEEWESIVRTCRKHPSVVLYCSGNEEVMDEAKIEFLRRLSAMQHELAPDAMFSPMEALKGIEYGTAEQMGERWTADPYPFNRERLAQVREFSDALASFAQGKLSYWSAYCDWREVDRWMQRYGRPILSHEVGILGSYLNLDLERRYEGLRIGTQLYASVRKNLTKAGLIDRAALYYRNSCRWLKLLRKHCIENVRKCGHIAGFDLLGFYDSQWTRCGYPCGIVNEFFETKPYESTDSVLQYNGESVLLLDHTNNRCFRCGERLDMELYASLFGDGPLERGHVEWYCTVGGQVALRGAMEVSNVGNGGVGTLGRIAFDMPSPDGPKKLTLHVRLSGGEYELGNEWDFWVFPDVHPALPANVRVVDRLDGEALEVLAGGGRVLLLGGAPFRTTPTMFQAAQAGRANGNMATIITEHPVFSRFPHEGFCDWQFHAMLEGGCTIEFNELNTPFEPILEFANSFKETLKKAAVFEVAVGTGRLFVCSLHMDAKDAAAAFLLEDLYRYCESDGFQPRNSLPIADLEALFREKPRLVAMPKTDIVDDPNVRRLKENMPG